MLKKKCILATSDLQKVKESKFIIICIGTPIDNTLNPEIKNFLNFFKILKKYIKKDHQIIIRSSVYPGICEKVFEILKNKTKNLVIVLKELFKESLLKSCQIFLNLFLEKIN